MDIFDAISRSSLSDVRTILKKNPEKVNSVSDGVSFIIFF